MDFTANSLEEHWMPFTPNREFKEEPRLVEKSSGIRLVDHRGGTVLDGSSGLFCVPAGHGRREIADAVHAQLLKNDYTAPFNLGHTGSFQLAKMVAAIAPDPINHVFFTNSGSESVDTALKICMAYHGARGDHRRQRFVSRERAYHGVNMGGVSLSGMVKNRDIFSVCMPYVVNMRHTWRPGAGGPDWPRAAPHGAIGFFRGYTYSAHPAACAAGIATQTLYREGGLFEQGAALIDYFQDAMYALEEMDIVTDVRGYGLMAGFDLKPGAVPGALGPQVQKRLFWNGLHVKFTGDSGIVAPPFISTEDDIDEMMDILRRTLLEYS